MLLCWCELVWWLIRNLGGSRLVFGGKLVVSSRLVFFSGLFVLLVRCMMSRLCGLWMCMCGVNGLVGFSFILLVLCVVFLLLKVLYRWV